MDVSVIVLQVVWSGDWVLAMFALSRPIIYERRPPDLGNG